MRYPARAQNPQYYPAGFTLIELMITVSIVVILSGMLIPSFSTYSRNQNIKQAQEQVKSDLRTAQNRALTGVGASNVNLNYWGIMFSPGATTYTLVSCNDAACNTRYNTQTSETLAGGAVVKRVEPAGISNKISFSKTTGDTNCTASDCVIVVGMPSSTNTECKSVVVNSMGLVKKVDNVACL